jgi:sphingolipid delta-4 desaturase
LVASFFFSVGLHPLGARWIQEHYLTHGEQETYSYYGVLNHVAFNVGFHNEHHDFPSVPWNRLPDIKKTAPGFYDQLSSHTSWTKLFFRFLFDQEISLFSRVVRKNRGKVALTDESRPDAELSL